jgi:hypothetical protein
MDDKLNKITGKLQPLMDERLSIYPIGNVNIRKGAQSTKSWLGLYKFNFC